MKVSLYRCTPDPWPIMALACRTCVGKIEEVTSDPVNLVKKVLRSGHESIAEHINVTFLIEGISRACSHQLVRHRHCSFSQLSQRYAKVGTLKDAECAFLKCVDGDYEGARDVLRTYFVFPESEKLVERMVDRITTVFYYYHDMIRDGMKPEDARAILPNCTKTDIMVTLNLRELMHICNERLCNRAQGEIRDLVHLMRVLAMEEIPHLEEFLVPKCEKCGVCFEEKSCGKYPARGHNKNNCETKINRDDL